jgi:hypothetical protein
VLVCHWSNRNGQLECRWQIEPSGDGPINDFDGHRTPSRACGPSSMQWRGR